MTKRGSMKAGVHAKVHSNVGRRLLWNSLWNLCHCHCSWGLCIDFCTQITRKSSTVMCWIAACPETFWNTAVCFETVFGIGKMATNVQLRRGILSKCETNRPWRMKMTLCNRSMQMMQSIGNIWDSNFLEIRLRFFDFFATNWHFLNVPNHPELYVNRWKRKIGILFLVVADLIAHKSLYPLRTLTFVSPK